MTRATFNREVFAKLWANHRIPTAKIAAAMGISRAGVSWHAHQMGLPGRDKVRRRLADPDVLREMWMAGVKASEIARYFGMAHHACVTTAARNMGLPKRQRGSSGKMNGGWKANITLAAFLEAKAGANMVRVAAQEREAMRVRMAA